MNLTHRWLVLLAVTFAWGLGCGGGGGGTKPTGSEKGPCYGNGSCNSGLVCLSEVCVKSPDAGASGAGGGGTSGGAGQAGGASGAAGTVVDAAAGAGGSTDGGAGTTGAAGQSETGGAGAAGAKDGGGAGAGGAKDAGANLDAGKADAGTSDGTGASDSGAADTSHMNDGGGASDASPGSCTAPCNTVAQKGAQVSRTVSSAAVPAMTGGAIVDGTYVVTGIVQYNGDSSAYALKETAVLSGNMDAWVASENGAADAHFTATFSAASATALSVHLCCPSATTVPIAYTSTSTTFTIVDPTNTNRVITLTRQ